LTGEVLSIGADAKALALLGQLIDAADDERASLLTGLRLESPELHLRLLRLLQACESTDDSHFLRKPIVNVLQSLAGSRWQPLRSDDVLGGYRLISELGRGGMSVVWLAEPADGVVKRRVAIKLPSIALGAETLVERFTRERDVLAALAHAHIARMYDAGMAPSGQPFIVLELVDGHAITQFCDERRLTIEARLRLFLQVLDAVAHAHKHLVVHRDLKPSNIMVDTQGHVKLLDFGVAKLLDAPEAGTAALTQVNGCALTPRYAAPEQLHQAAISTATDVYSLGVVLYELLTGVSPYGRAVDSVGEVAHAILTVEPVRCSQVLFDDTALQARSVSDIRRLRAALSGDLETVLLKALRKATADRYGSVERFSDDIQRYLASRPITARPPSWRHVMSLFVRRHRAASLTAGLASVLVLGFATLALQQHAQSRLQEARGTAVSGFLSDLVSDAEADETHAGRDVTGKEMVDSAVSRARLQFADRPQLKGELLAELGRMYFRLGEHDKAVRTLNEALALLEAHAAPDDPALNKVRAHLAGQLIEDGLLDRAESLARLALAACASRDRECAKARAYASRSLLTLESGRGHADAALAHARRAVAEMEAGFGPNDANTVDALEFLAVMARNAGRLQEAGEAMDRAVASSDQRALHASNRIQMLRTKALLDADLGRFDSSRAQLQALVTRTTDAGERAIQLRVLANIFLLLGDPDAAQNAAEQAIALAAPGSAKANTLFAREALASALALRGYGPQGLSEAGQAARGLQALGFGARSIEVLRVHRLLGELLLRQGDFASARVELASVVRVLEEEPTRYQVDLGQTLDLLACLLRETGDPSGAKALHAKARSAYENNLPPDHPFFDRNTLYQEVATDRGKTAQTQRQAVHQAADSYKARFPEHSLWRSLIDRGLDNESCTSGATEPCRFIL
jgi:serine/threonine protein kinase